MPLRVLLAGLILLAGLSGARAGDIASLDMIGFSADGKTFAFQEYGIQDGSGFPYVNRYYIDTLADRFRHSPIRVVLQEPDATVEEARAGARKQGEQVSALSDASLRAHGGATVAANPVTRTAPAVRRAEIPLDADAPLVFSLEEVAVPQPEDCRFYEEVRGFRLSVDGRVLHEDETVPDSRVCPFGYSIGAVRMAPTRDRIFAVLLAVRRMGFEGPAYRWLAVTGQLPE